jgi:hypothetical protein
MRAAAAAAAGAGTAARGPLGWWRLLVTHLQDACHHLAKAAVEARVGYDGRNKGSLGPSGGHEHEHDWEKGRRRVEGQGRAAVAAQALVSQMTRWQRQHSSR